MFGRSKVTWILDLHLIIQHPSIHPSSPFILPSSTAHRTSTNIGIMMEYLICFQSAKQVLSKSYNHLGMYSIPPLSYNVPITPSLAETPDTKREQMCCGPGAEIIGEASRWYIIQHKICINLSPYTSLHLIDRSGSLIKTGLHQRTASGTIIFKYFLPAAHWWVVFALGLIFSPADALILGDIWETSRQPGLQGLA